MKKLSLAVGLSVAAVSLLGPALPAVAEDVSGSTDTSTVASTADPAESTPESFKDKAERLISEAPISDEEKATLREVVAALPDDAPERAAAFNEKMGLDHATEWQETVAAALDPTDYVCEQTPLVDWVVGTTDIWGPYEGLYYMLSPLPMLPTWDAALWGKESSDNTFGLNGEYTTLLNQQMKQLRGFWDVPSDIELIPMHGAPIYVNPDRIKEILILVYGMPDNSLTAWTARNLGNMGRYLPGFQRGNHPVLTFNAFALDPAGDRQLEDMGVTKRIVMGDGILTGMAGIGLDPKVAPRSILAHEYGHHVQYARNLFESDLTGPEATRRTELMADGMATYFMVHSLGEALNAKRTLDNARAFYNVGDCNFASDGHHGTPNQRIRASEWAVDVVEAAANQGVPAQLNGVKFAKLFDAALPDLVAPDAN